MDGERAPFSVDERRPDARSLVERIVRFVAATSSVESVFGQPVEAHGRTVIPVARVYFTYGAGTGPELGGRSVERLPEGQVAPALTSGGGGGGLGIARPAGFIEIAPEGSRFVPATRDWRGTLAVAVTIAATLFLLRPPWTARGGRSERR